MSKLQLLQKLEKTHFTDNSKELLGRIIKKEFDATESEDRAFELLQLAYHHKTPQLNEMLDGYNLTDFKWL